MSDRFSFELFDAFKYTTRTNTTNRDYRCVFLVKGVQRGNSGEQILFQKHLHLAVPIQDLGLRFPPTATRTSVSFSAHWQGERDCACVFWPPWDPVRLQQVIYSNSVQHVVCQMGIKPASVCVHVKAGAGKGFVRWLNVLVLLLRLQASWGAQMRGTHKAELLQNVVFYIRSFPVPSKTQPSPPVFLSV